MIAGVGHEKIIPVNELGYRIGENHQKAKIPDQDVEWMRQLHEEHGISYPELAEKFEISERMVGCICRYERRNQFAAAFKTIEV